MATEAIEPNSSLTLPISGIGRNADSWPEFLYRLQMNDINHEASLVFIKRTWLISIYSSSIYCVLLFLGLRWMKHRRPFSLRLPLAIWSGGLFVFSLCGTIAVWPEFWSLAWTKGLVATYCDNSYRHDGRLFYWYTVFVLSKVAELLDTAFIVLRKQKLITLHWVHHILTLVYCFFVYRDQVSTARWMVALNFAVHTVMYGYYSLKALQVKIPRIIALVITTGQIVQMILGLFINTHTLIYALFSSPNPCQCSLRASVAGFLLYALFFYLFARFFADAYLVKPKVGLHQKDPNVLNGDCLHKQAINEEQQQIPSDLNNNNETSSKLLKKTK